MREVPARLSRLGERFSEWRKSRVPGERIPDRLWKSAAKLAAEYGLNRTATVLKLDYYSLKRHLDCLDGEVTEEGSNAAFIELPSVAVAHASECVIEFEDGAGGSMRMHLKGTEIPDLLALGRSFWNGQ